MNDPGVGATTSDRDPNEGYVSDDEKGWVPLPVGMRRMIIAVNIPDDRDKFDVAIEADCYFDNGDVTVWESREDFVADWTDGVA